MYIEYHGTWTHGGKPFDKDEEECKAKLSTWQEKAKTSKFYQTAVYVWTDLDLRKRQCAINNGLNYLTFYDLNQFKRWFNSLIFNNNNGGH